jgi:hypothetical protein
MAEEDVLRNRQRQKEQNAPFRCPFERELLILLIFCVLEIKGLGYGWPNVLIMRHPHPHQERLLKKVSDLNFAQSVDNICHSEIEQLHQNCCWWLRDQISF